jgi:hypothetical protein
MKTPPADPTPEQLALAFRNMSRPGWPPTLEAALQRHAFRVALVAVARGLGRPAWAPAAAHSLPRPPAPPTPGTRELAGPMKNGRSPYSIATGPKTDLTSWRGSSPKNMMAGAPSIKRVYFDARKAAANDLED